MDKLEHHLKSRHFRATGSSENSPEIALRAWRKRCGLAGHGAVGRSGAVGDWLMTGAKRLLAVVLAAGLFGPVGAATVDGIKFLGDQSDRNVGIFVGGNGDFNADGRDDVIVSAWKTSSDDDGRVYIIYGTPNFDSDFRLGDILSGNGSLGIYLSPDSSRDLDRFGRSADFLGDVNGDGIDDLIVGAIYAGRSGAGGVPEDAGEAYVVFGRLGGLPNNFNVGALFAGNGGNGTQGFVVEGVKAQDELGRSVSRAGDVNGDGINDILIGAPVDSQDGGTGAGEAYVIYGRATGFPAEIAAASLASGDGSLGFTLRGAVNRDRTGIVAEAGDVDNDGIDDIIIGALSASPLGLGAAGAAYVVYGRSGGFPPVVELGDLHPQNGGNGDDGFVVAGVGAVDRLGLVHGAGDINDDGFDDVLMGAFRADPNGLIEAGAAYAVFGRPRNLMPPLFRLDSLLPANGGDGSTGFVIPGSNAGDRLASVSTAGDVNGDGISDIVVGSFRGEDGAGGEAEDVGEAYIIFGRTVFPPMFLLNSLRVEFGADGSSGGVIRGEDAGGRQGRAVSEAGDFDGDGFDDVITGAWQADGEGNGLNADDAGEAYLVFGRSGLMPSTIEVGVLDEGLTNSLVGTCAGQSATLYDDSNFQSELSSYFVGAHVPLDASVNNQASSITVEPGLRVLLFTDASDVQNPNLIVTSDTSLSGSVNNSVSALSVECINPFSPPQVLNPGEQESRIGETAALVIQATDPDGRPLTYSADGLPPVTQINATNGLISGLLSTPGIYDVQVSVQNDLGGRSDVQFTWIVTDATGNVPPSLENPGAQASVLGDSVLLALQGSDVEGDPLTYSAAGLPSGLTVDGASGIISGIAGSAGAFNVTATVTDSNGASASVEFPWTVSSNLIDASFDTSSEGFGYLDDAFRSTNEPAYANGAFDAAGGFSGGGLRVDTGAIDDEDILGMSGAWSSSFTMSAEATVQLSLRYNLTLGGEHEDDELAQVLVSVDGQLLGAGGSDFVVQLIGDGQDSAPDQTTGWQTFSANVPLGAGNHTLRIGAYHSKKTLADEFAFARFDDVVLALENRAPVLINPGDQTSVLGSSVSLSLLASDPDNDQISFSASNLPTGLSINAGSGLISGTPTVFGQQTVTVTASDGNGASDSQSFVWRVTDANNNLPPEIVNPGNQSGVIGNSASLALSASDPDGDPLSFSAAGLPPGLALNSVNGSITGTLEQGGAFSVTVTVSDGALSDSTSFTWDVITSGEVFVDDFESNLGWIINPDGSDTATTGQWEVGDPQPTFSDSTPMQLGDTTSGVQALITQVAAGSGLGDFDIDDGNTSALSPPIEVPQGNVELTFNYYFAHLDNATSDDFLRVSVRGASGDQALLQETGVGAIRAGQWSGFGANLNAFAGQSIRLLVEAADAEDGSLIEAGIDDIVLSLVNTPPVLINPGNQSSELGTAVTLALQASDADNDVLSFSASGLPSGLSLNGTSGLISGTPASAGSFNVTVQVSDGNASDSVQFAWAVLADTGDVLIDASFDIGTDGFSYLDDAFRGTSEPTYADGAYEPAGGFSGGGVRVDTGGLDAEDIEGMSGGWARVFSLAATDTVTLTLRYNLTLNGFHEPSEFAQALVAVDGQLLGAGGMDFVAELVGDGNNGADKTTGWQLFSTSVTLGAGTHTLTLGEFHNRKTTSNEIAFVQFDDVMLLASNGGGEPSYEDDFESDMGWSINPDGTDTAVAGQWEIANPEPTFDDTTMLQLGDATSGVQTLVTQAAAGVGAGSFDVDEGVSSAVSPLIIVPGSPAVLSMNYYFAHLANADSSDFLEISVRSGAGDQVLWLVSGSPNVRAGQWDRFSADISQFAGQAVQIRVRVNDGGGGSLIEAGIDDLTIDGN